MKDIVVDTNVFVHAQSRKSPHFIEAARFVGALMAGTSLLCLDREFNLDDQGQPGSLIGSEYQKHLKPQTYGFIVLAALLASGRFKLIGTKVSDDARKWSDGTIGKPRDRTFFRVAALSAERVLVSHDEEDFPSTVRREAKRKFSVEICFAEAAVAKLQG